MDTQNSNLPFKVNEVINVLQTAPDILARNEASVSACTNAGQTLLDTIKGNGGIDTDEIDTAVQEYLVKSKKTVENMNNRRKLITQMFTAVSKRFTSLESSIDAKSAGSIPYQLQAERNNYAAKKLAEQKRREEEARRIQLVENEKNQYRSDISLLLEKTYAAYVEGHLNAINNTFNRATLETYNDVGRKINEVSTTFSWSAFVQNVKDTFQTFHMDADTRKSIKKEVALQKKAEFSERYAFELDELKRNLIDRLPSLRKRLEEEEELRRTNAAEAARLEEERRRQEAEVCRNQEEARKQREAEAKAKAEADKAAAEVQAAFDFNAASMAPSPTKAKVKKKIQFTNPQGFMQVYQMWFMREGINMGMEELEKVHKKMISYCEKVANKDGELIQSAFVKYVDDVTAK